MWNERYAADDFVYGTEPNEFLVSQAQLLRGPVLSLAEGEGRNAVYLASLGFDVLGVDSSEVGLAKAHRLAAAKGVTIRTEVADLATYDLPKHHYGAVISISAHLPSAVRRRLYPLLEQSLTPAGIFLLESYTQAQLARNTGGPKDPDLLPSLAELKQLFPQCELLLAQEIEREVHEGQYHTGLASVVQFIARKPG